jgi:uncharacterized protein DUF4350
MRRQHSLLTLMVPILALLTTSSMAADPLAILWDDTHDDVTPPLELVPDELSGQYSDFAAVVAAQGHTLTELDGPPGGLTAAVLAGYDVLMVFDAEAAFTVTEITDIQAFVAAGGMVFIAGDRPIAFNQASHNTLLTPFGVTFTGVDLLDIPNTNAAFDLSVWNPDPLTAGLTVVDFFSSGTLAVAGAGTKTLGSTAPDGYVGYAYGADGKVVVLSDADALANNLLDPGDDEAKLVVNLLAHFAALAVPPAPIEVTIDIKPDGVPNSVNPKSKGVVPVAILTTSVESGDALDFDPWDAIDPTTIVFGPASAPPDSEGTAEDVDADGDLDLLLHFETQEIGVQCGDTELGLTALTYDGQTVIGADSITTPGCN